MSAIRLARAHTHRDRVLKFAGCYHGHVDALLASAGSGLATLGIPSSAGRADGRDGRHDRRPYNDVDAAAVGRRALRRGARGHPRRAGGREHGRRPAGAGLPRGAARALRRGRRAARLRRGDHRLPRRARRRAGALRRPARPDDPRQDRRRRPAARRVRRRADVMHRLAPAGDVYQAGTLSGNPLATAAGLSVLRRLRDEASTRSSSGRRAARGGLRRARAVVQRVGAMVTLFMPDGPVRDFDDAARATPSATARSSATCSSAASTSRRRSSRRCSCRSRTATTRSTARSRPLTTSAVADLWETIAAGAAPRASSGQRRCAAAERGARARLLAARREERAGSASRRSTRATSSTTGAAGFRPGRRRHGAAARRLPLRPRARPHRRSARVAPSPTSPS